MRSIVGLLVLVGCSARSSAPAGDPIKEAGAAAAVAVAALPAARVVRAPIPDTTLVVSVRPLVTNLAAGDPLGLAIHWEDTTRPTPMTYHPPYLRARETLDSLELAVTGPDGAQATGTASFALVPGAVERADSHMEPTLVLTFDAAGLEEAHGYRGTWRSAPPDLAKPGVYRVQVSGTLVAHDAAPIAFVAPAIELAVGVPGVAPLETLRRTADTERRRRAPDAVPVERGKHHSSGFVAGVVIEDERGNRLVRIALDDVGFGYRLHTATFSPDGTLADYAEQSLGTCVGAGTRVDTERGARPIEDLVVGDRVWSYDLATGERRLTRILEVRAYVAPHALRFGALVVTAEHPIWADGAWRTAGSLDGGETLLASSLEATVAPSPRMHEGPLAVFDLTVEAPNNFFAGGILVHNKSPIYNATFYDPWTFMWSPPAD